MKIGRILFLMSALAFSQVGMANHQASDKKSAADKTWVLDVDKQLEYCHKQEDRAGPSTAIRWFIAIRTTRYFWTSLRK